MILKTWKSRSDPRIQQDSQKYKVHIFYKDEQRIKIIQEQYYQQLNEAKNFTSFEINFVSLPLGKIQNYLRKTYKAGPFVPMVVIYIVPHAEFGRNDHREDTPHFTSLITSRGSHHVTNPVLIVCPLDLNEILNFLKRSLRSHRHWRTFN